MRKLMTIMMFAPIILFAQDPQPKTKNEEKALKMVELLQAEKFKKITRQFDTTLTRKLPADDLAYIWKGVNNQLGGLEKLEDISTISQGGLDIVLIKARFERFPLVIKVTINEEEEITGFFMVPAPTYAPYKEPEYLLIDSILEEDVKVVSGKFELEGAFTYPRYDSMFPAVVLVHGSGANDMDQSLGPNKPFKDLSLGMSGRGVGVLRYTKRTKQYDVELVAGMDTMTVDDEVTDDAVAALDMARSMPGVDPDRIWLVGHSLGAMMAPRILERAPWVRGAIMLAGPARNLQDLIVMQYNYILGLDGIDENDQKEIDKITAQAERVKSPDLASIDAKQLPMGLPAAYWLSLREYEQVAVAKTIDRPVLILQGEKDYQVTMDDYAIWLEALGEKENVAFHSFPGMTHLFSEGKGVPADYNQQQNVDLKVIEEMIGFIKKNR